MCEWEWWRQTKLTGWASNTDVLCLRHRKGKRETRLGCAVNVGHVTGANDVQRMIGIDVLTHGRVTYASALGRPAAGSMDEGAEALLPSASVAWIAIAHIPERS